MDATRAPRRGWRRLVATLAAAIALMGAVVVLLASHRPSGHPSNVTSIREGLPATKTGPVARGTDVAGNSPEQLARKIAATLHCARTGYVHDDMYFYDSMFGVNCYASGSTPVTMIRAYQDPDSIPVVLQDWQPMINPIRGIFLVTGKQWFAVGSKQVLQALSTNVVGASEPTQRVPRATDTRKAELHGDETKCIRFVSGTLADRALNPAQYSGEIPALNTIYPGIKALVGALETPRQLATLNSLNASDPYGFQAYLSTFGPSVKQFCRSRPWVRASAGSH